MIATTKKTSARDSFKPKCGVIGTGQEGAALVQTLTSHGIEVRMANAGHGQSISVLADLTGAKHLPIEEVVEDVDILFLCIPMKAVSELPTPLFTKCPKSTVVVDCCNYYPSRDGPIEEIEQGLPESVWVKKQISRDVVKAFNSILAGALQDCSCPRGSENRIAVPISGDDEKAKELVSNLIDELGFDVCDLGPLSQSWKQQPGSCIYCTNLNKSELASASPMVQKDELAKFRDMAYQKMTELSQELDWRGLVKLLRETNPGLPEKAMQESIINATAESIST